MIVFTELGAVDKYTTELALTLTLADDASDSQAPHHAQSDQKIIR